ncbi:hypothetical protein [Agrococcus lahaulensis]|uniref:hypothetical protein n=1 Tax=Agrococcus lahaulensis TaxID=341722 RepID=UPI0012EB1A41|nr:hypothetical protein [Agrococcus lahaulensis]
MLRRLAGGAALVLAAITLSGCTQPMPEVSEPAPTTTSTSQPPPTTEQAQSTFEAFYAAVDAQFAAGVASADALSEHATSDLAERWAGFIREDLAAGQVSRGVLEVTAIEAEEVVVDGIRVRLCTDGRNIVTTDPQGLRIPPSGLVAWSAEFEDSDSGLLLANLQPLQDQSICGL